VNRTLAPLPTKPRAQRCRSCGSAGDDFGGSRSPRSGPAGSRRAPRRRLRPRADR
jgi:hypothetical protein